MTVLVTGAAAFLGSHVVDRLLGQGETIRVLIRPEEHAQRLVALETRATGVRRHRQTAGVSPPTEVAA